MAYSQGLLRSISSDREFIELIKSEADQVLDEGSMVLTLKNNILIPNAGIDRSNVPEGQAILWPQDPFGAARKIRSELMTHFHLKEFGVVISDSHCQPLRVGTTGIAIGWSGFEGIRDERGASDLYGRKMAYTQVAVVDSLSSAALLEMGETNESTPFVLVRGARVTFTSAPANQGEYFIEPRACIYSGLYRLEKF